MRKDDISLAHLGELLATEKVASGKSVQTVDWYTGVIARYAEWLVSQELAPTLAHFSLEHVRAYIVALQGIRARALHPAQPTENRPFSDATINSYVRRSARSPAGCLRKGIPRRRCSPGSRRPG